MFHFKPTLGKYIRSQHSTYIYKHVCHGVVIYMAARGWVSRALFSY